MKRRVVVILTGTVVVAAGLACSLLPQPGSPTPPAPLPATEARPLPTEPPPATPPPSPTPVPKATAIVPPRDVAALLAEIEIPPEAIPEAYVEVPADELGLTPESMSDEDFSVSRIVLLLNEASLELSLAMLFPLEGTADQLLFDSAIDEPDLLVTSLVEGMAGEGVEVTEVGSLAGLEGVGDAAAGYGFRYAAEGLVMRVDVVVFRRGPAGAMTAVVYTDGRSPELEAGALARTLDAEISAALE